MKEENTKDLGLVQGSSVFSRFCIKKSLFLLKKVRKKPRKKW